MALKFSSEGSELKDDHEFLSPSVDSVYILHWVYRLESIYFYGDMISINMSLNVGRFEKDPPVITCKKSTSCYSKPSMCSFGDVAN